MLATPETRRGASGGLSVSRRMTEWVFGILGGIAVFLGLFILLGPEGEYVGIGGDWAWRVGDIAPAWAFGLLIGGAVLLLVTLAMVLSDVRSGAAKRPEEAGLAELAWHFGIFVAVNGFIWLQDFALGGGLDYAYLVTIPWGIGLLVHGYAYYSDRRTVAALEEAMTREQEETELEQV